VAKSTVAYTHPNFTCHISDPFSASWTNVMYIIIVFIAHY